MISRWWSMRPLLGIVRGVNDDAAGTMARRDDCRAFADRWGLKMISIDMLERYIQAQAQNKA